MAEEEWHECLKPQDGRVTRVFETTGGETTVEGYQRTWQKKQNNAWKHTDGYGPGANYLEYRWTQWVKLCCFGRRPVSVPQSSEEHRKAQVNSAPTFIFNVQNSDLQDLVLVLWRQRLGYQNGAFLVVLWDFSAGAFAFGTFLKSTSSSRCFGFPLHLGRFDRRPTPWASERRWGDLCELCDDEGDRGPFFEGAFGCIFGSVLVLKR